MNAHDDRLEAMKAKIAAMLALAAEGSGASPEEAANAAAMAQRLMLKYSLTEEQIRAAGGQKSAEYEKRAVRYSSQGVSRYLHAQVRLLGVLADFNFCSTVYLTGAKGRASGDGWIIGQPEHIDLVLDMYMRLMPQVLRMGQAAYVAYRNERLNDWYADDKIAQEASWRRNHFQGVVTAIRTRLADERRKAEASTQANEHRADAAANVSDEDLKLLTAATEGEQVRALVAIKGAELAEAVKRFVPNMGKSRATKVNDRSGYAAGLRDGQRLDIHSRTAVEG